MILLPRLAIRSPGMLVFIGQAQAVLLQLTCQIFSRVFGINFKRTKVGGLKITRCKIMGRHGNARGHYRRPKQRKPGRCHGCKRSHCSAKTETASKPRTRCGRANQRRQGDGKTGRSQDAREKLKRRRTADIHGIAALLAHHILKIVIYLIFHSQPDFVMTSS